MGVKLWPRRREATTQAEESRYSFDDFVQWKQFGDTAFPLSGGTGVQPFAGAPRRAEFSDNHVWHYKHNGIVHACMGVRQSIFAEVAFRFASVDNGHVGKLFGTPALSILERPWPNGTTGELATRMIQDVDLCGNFYAVRHGDRLYRRNPLWMSIVLSGDPLEEEYVDVLGYVYAPRSGSVYTYLPDQVCHWSPIPDPEHEYRGMSWLTPILREIHADEAATTHKETFFRNGAVPNMVVKFPENVMTQDQFDRFKANMHAEYDGVHNAYKTLYLAPGADVIPVGKDLQQLAFDETQGRDETRIAAAAGVPAVIVGIKESLQGSSLNTGNYTAARRRFADGTMRPLYRSAAAALETLVPAPQAHGRSKLWYDDSQVAFFREDRADAATIQSTRAATIKTLTDAGFTAESVLVAVAAEDMSLLVHSGLYSVQLWEPGSKPDAKP